MGGLDSAIMYSEEVDYDVVSDFGSIFCTEGEVRTTQAKIMEQMEVSSGNDPLTVLVKCNDPRELEEECVSKSPSLPKKHKGMQERNGNPELLVGKDISLEHI